MERTNAATPSRRTLLAISGALGTALLAGCTGEDDRRAATPTASPLPTPNSTADRPTPDEPAPDEPTRTDVDRVDDFYLENRSEESRDVEVELRREGAGGPVVAGRYSVPGRTAAEFIDVGEEGAVYEVRATLGDGRELEDTWSVDDCPNEYEGDRDAAVVVTGEGELSYRENECDAIAVGYEVASGDAGQFRATPTPER